MKEKYEQNRTGVSRVFATTIKQTISYGRDKNCCFVVESKWFEQIDYCGPKSIRLNPGTQANLQQNNLKKQHLHYEVKIFRAPVTL